MKTNRKQYAYVSIALALVLVTVLGVLPTLNSAIAASGVTLNQNATVVASPFTEAVQKVRGSVVGVNNYATYTGRGNGYGNNYGGFGSFFDDFFGDSNPFDNYGYGYGYGQPDAEENNRQVLQGSGSGVVVAKGYVLTNYHVVEGSTALEVTTEDKVYPAQLMGTSEAKDLAVLYVDGLELEPVVLGDSDVLNVGDWAICIGNPLSFTGTTTVGIISALGREVSGKSTDAYGKRVSNTMIQTDAAINSGNSGGGMFNVAGELVGVPSLKYTSSAYGQASVEGIGMAIPINVAKPLLEDVLAGKGNVQSTPSTGITSAGRPRIGVTVSNMNPNSYAVANGLLPNGAYVSEVEENAPADKGGVKVGDIVVEIDGNIIQNTTQMTSYLQSKQAGDTVDVKVYRVKGGLDNVQGGDIPDGEYIDLKVKLAILDDVQQ